MLRMSERALDDVVILDLHGTVRPWSADITLDDKVRSVLFRGYRKLLLNLAHMSSADASAISALVGALLTAREAGGEIRLLNVTRRMKDLLVIVALYEYFTVFDSEQDALESFRSGPESCRAHDATAVHPALASVAA